MNARTKKIRWCSPRTGRQRPRTSRTGLWSRLLRLRPGMPTKIRTWRMCKHNNINNYQYQHSNANTTRHNIRCSLRMWSQMLRARTGMVSQCSLEEVDLVHSQDVESVQSWLRCCLQVARATWTWTWDSCQVCHDAVATMLRHVFLFEKCCLVFCLSNKSN